MDKDFIARMMDDMDEMLYGKRPRGTKRSEYQERVMSQLTNSPIDTSKTVEELAYSELLGKDVKILKK